MRQDSAIQWYNENEGRAYPVDEQATRLDDAGQRLPDDILVDLSIMVPPTHVGAFVSSVRLSSTSVTIGISSPAGALLSGVFLRQDLQAYRAYGLTPVVPDVSGWVAFGSRNPSAAEHYRFSGPQQSGLDARATRVVASVPVIKFLRLGGHAEQSADQIVNWASSSSVVVQRDPVATNKLLLKLTPDAQVSVLGPCNAVAVRSACGVTPIRSINGVCADEDGIITLRFV